MSRSSLTTFLRLPFTSTTSTSSSELSRSRFTRTLSGLSARALCSPAAVVASSSARPVRRRTMAARLATTLSLPGASPSAIRSALQGFAFSFLRLAASAPRVRMCSMAMSIGYGASSSSYSSSSSSSSSSSAGRGANVGS